jgi:hypothetical protein
VVIKRRGKLGWLSHFKTEDMASVGFLEEEKKRVGGGLR